VPALGTLGEACYNVLGYLRAGQTCDTLPALVSMIEHEMNDEKKAKHQLVRELEEPLQNARLHEQVREQAQRLEPNVADRTAELMSANPQLRQEVDERERVSLEIQRRLQETTLLYRVSALIASAPDISEALHAVCAELAGFLRVSQAGFASLNPEQTAAEIVADLHPPNSHGALGAIIPVTGNPSMAYVLEHRSPLVVSDAQADPVLYPVRDLMLERRVRSILIVPVIAEGDIIGTLGFDAFEPRVFSASDIDLVQHVANQAGQLLIRKRTQAELQRRAQEMAALQEAVAIERARLLESERAARAQTEVLREAAHVMGASLDVEQTLRLILDQLRRILVYATSSVLVLRDGDALDLVAAAGYENGEFVSRSARKMLQQSPILSQMARDLKPVISGDVRGLEGWIWVPGAEHVRSWLGVPLVAHGKMIGALMVDHAEPDFFGESELQVVQALAQHAAQALENARLFEETGRLKAFNESIVQGIAEGILIEDGEGRITFVNPAMEAMLGYPAQALLGRSWKLIVPDDQIGSVSRRMERRPEGVGGRYEAVLLAESGRRVPVVVAAQPMFEGGHFSGVLSAFTDITERVRAERELQERRLYLEAVLASAPDAIVTVDAQGCLVEWNSGAERLFGYSRDEVIGRQLDELVTNPDTLEEAVANTRRVLGGKAVPPTETVRYRKQGTPVDVLLAGSPILVDDDLTGVVGVYTDIGERKHAERALRKANRGLQVLSRSHEILSRAKDMPDLLTAVCRAAVGVGGYRLAWVGIAEQDTDRLVRPVAQAGFEEGYLDTVQITWDDSERGHGPTGTAIRNGRPAIARNVLTDPAFAPWREQAIRRGYASCIALPLMAQGRAFGALSIYAAEADAFDVEEVDLLAEVANNLAYGMTALQTRDERQHADEVLRSYAERLETLHQIDRAIVEAKSPEAIAQGTLARIGSLVPCRRARIIAFGAESDLPAVLATHTDSGTGPTNAGEPASAAPSEGAPAEISIPLTAQGELIGVLHIESRQGSTFTPDQIETVYEVATPLAVAIQNARLHEQLRQYAGSLAETVSQRTRELKAERDRTRAILESLGEAVIVSDVSGAVLYTNPAVAALTGFGNEEALGQNWWMLQGDGHSSAAYAQAQAALGERRTWRGETTSRRKDGTLYDAEVTVAPLFSPDDSSRLIGSVWVQRDISPLKEAERIKDQFVSNVSHELRTPLSVLTLSVGNLDRLYARLDDDKRRGMVRSIREQVALLNDLVGDVLEISRIDSGSISAERRTVDLAQLVREEADKQRPLAQARRQVLRVIGLETLVVRGDEGQLRQVIRNLVDNGIKYTPDEGQITCECRVQVGLPILAGSGAWVTGLPPAAQDKSLALRRWAVLRVLDTGIGIEQKDLLHLCERFFRVKTEGNIPGTGLGLSIARELVELNGGRIAVASVPGEGSAFSVFLPLEEDNHESERRGLGR